jgi:ankyrin repeat protein
VVAVCREGTKADLARIIKKYNKNIFTSQFGNGQYPLNIAAEAGNLEVVSTLVEKYKTKVDVIDGANMTPLLLACKSGRMAVIEYLITKGGADVKRTSLPQQYSALHYLASIGSSGNVPMGDIHAASKRINLLVSKSADVNQTNNNGETALHIAASQGHPLILGALLDCNSELNMRNGKGETAVQLAAKNGQSDIVLFLMARGADISWFNPRLPEAQSYNPAIIQALTTKDILDVCLVVVVVVTTGSIQQY